MLKKKKTNNQITTRNALYTEARGQALILRRRDIIIEYSPKSLKRGYVTLLSPLLELSLKYNCFGTVLETNCSRA